MIPKAEKPPDADWSPHLGASIIDEKEKINLVRT